VELKRRIVVDIVIILLSVVSFDYFWVDFSGGFFGDYSWDLLVI